MKRCATVILGVGLAMAGASFARQQTSNPANTHVNDNASFGNKKAPKNDKAPTSRTVSGQVTDETGQALQGAMVTLVDKKTNERESFFTKKDGRYQFEDLGFNKDYEVQARYKAFASESRKVSQFDTLPKPVRMLEINTHKPSSTAENQSAPK